MKPNVIAATLFIALCSAHALAQPVQPAPEEPPPEPEPEPPPPPPPPPPPAPVNVTVNAVVQTEEEKPKTEDQDSDHDLFTGHVGMSWFGITNVPIATGAPGGTIDVPVAVAGEPTYVPAPAIGVRYWMTNTIGLDIGVGFSVSTGNVATTTAARDKATITALLFHFGLPISLVDGKHISLQLTPEFNLGHARAEVEPAVQPDPPPNADLTGTRIDVGARIGGEIHFGFIGVPELALEGSIGAYATWQTTNVQVGDAHATQDNFLFTTAEYNSPWDFFTQHLRARYYF